MKNPILEELKNNKSILDYFYTTLDEDGFEVSDLQGFRNTEKLVLMFPDSSILEIETFCSGCAENTSLTFTKGNNG